MSETTKNWMRENIVKEYNTKEKYSPEKTKSNALNSNKNTTYTEDNFISFNNLRKVTSLLY